MAQTIADVLKALGNTPAVNTGLIRPTARHDKGTLVFGEDYPNAPQVASSAAAAIQATHPKDRNVKEKTITPVLRPGGRMVCQE